MLYEASFALEAPKPSPEAVHRPQIERYLADWGRRGDRALVAERDGRPVGAAWYRLFPRTNPGYGFVDDETPELSIAVAPHARGAGVGRSLLTALLAAARTDGFQALSLSVSPANRAACTLYDRCGFVVVVADDGQGGRTMRVAL